MGNLAHRLGLLGLALFVLAGMMELACPQSRRQEELIVRPGPPAVDNLETDANNDGIPDGWYNARDVKWMNEGGAAGPHFVRFDVRRKQAGHHGLAWRSASMDEKPRRSSSGSGSAWAMFSSASGKAMSPACPSAYRAKGCVPSDGRVSDPGPTSVHDRWTEVAKRIPIPSSCRDLIMTVGLMGATGTLDVDGLSFDLMPVGGEETTNLVVNGDFELGDPALPIWIADKDVHRVFPGDHSAAAMELSRAKSRLYTGVAIPVEPFQALDVSIAGALLRHCVEPAVRAARFFFLDDFGKPIAGLKPKGS